MQKIKLLSKGFSVTHSPPSMALDGQPGLSVTARPTGWVIVSLDVCMGSPSSSCDLQVLRANLRVRVWQSVQVPFPSDYLHTSCTGRKPVTPLQPNYPTWSPSIRHSGGQCGGVLFISIRLNPPNALSMHSTGGKVSSRQKGTCR